MRRGHGPIVTGVHGLHHVQRFRSAALADDNAVRPHTQRINHQVALVDGAGALDVHRPCFKPHHMPLLKLQLGGVLNSDDALLFGNEA